MQNLGKQPLRKKKYGACLKAAKNVKAMGIAAIKKL